MDFLKSHKKVVAIAGGALVLLVLTITVVMVSDESRESNPTAKKQISQKPSHSDDIPSSPQITFGSLELLSQAPAVPSTMNIYKLKGQFSLDEAKAFAGKFGLNQYKERNLSVLFFNKDEQSGKRGYMIFDRESGSFSFYSYGDHPAGGNTGDSPTLIAQKYITQLGISDPTITCPITYERQDEPGITFVECHRDWQKVGLPILNMGGLMNIQDTEQISALKLGYVDQDAPDDTAVFNTSTGQDGKKRPDDFNTITVGIAQGNKIELIQSTVRQIETAMQVGGNNQIVSPSQALQKFKNNQPDVSFVFPAGEGSVDWKAVFPRNQARAEKGEVSEYKLVYLENSLNQQYLTPMYVIRGASNTDTGYTVSFIQGVAATKIGLSVATTTYQAVAGISDEVKRNSLQLKTFTLTDAPVPPTASTPRTTVPAGQAPPPSNPGACKPAVNQLSPIHQLPTVGSVGPWSIAPFGSKQGEYYLIQKNNVWPDFRKVSSEFSASRLSWLARDFDEIMEDFEKVSGSAANCPIRVSGASPTLFFYGMNGSEYSVLSPNSTTYAYPQTANGYWHVTMEDGNSLINGRQTPYIYYEYMPVSFEKQKNGWIVQKASLETFATSILATALHLTTAETERLVFELNHAASKTDASTLFVAPIPQREVDAKLPLQVSGADQTLRYHFQVRKAIDGQLPHSPELLPVKRTSSLILELGATYSK